MPMLAAELLQSNLGISDPGVVATQHVTAGTPDDGRLQTLFGPQTLSGSIPDTTIDASYWTFRQQIDDIFARSEYMSRPEPSGITPVEPQTSIVFLNVPAYQFGLPETAPLVPSQSLDIYAFTSPSVNGWSKTAQYVPSQNPNTNAFTQADSYGWPETTPYVAFQNSNPNPLTQLYSNGWPGAAPYQLQQDSSVYLPYSSGWTPASNSSLSNLPYWAQPDYAGPSFTPRPQTNSQIGDTRPNPSAQPEVQSQPAQPEVRSEPARSHITFRRDLSVKPKHDPEYPGVTSSEATRFDRIFSSVKRFFTGAKKRDALSMDAEEKACFNEINVIRAQHHLPLLTFSPTVKLVSDLQATEQANTHTMKHSNNDPQLSSHFQRLNLVKLGRDTMHDGENAAMGAQSGESVAHMWMGSAGHRRPILDRYLKIGSVSRAFDNRGTPYWTFNASTGNEIA